MNAGFATLHQTVSVGSLVWCGASNFTNSGIVFIAERHFVASFLVFSGSHYCELQLQAYDVSTARR